ncbi:MAG: RluA family pseudouridine synthase [Acidimicrobiia bacterium]|nr:RluA family pseudouridine synthase [Acidimicrobiia bacterium]
MARLELTVPDDAAGERLDRFLAAVIPDRSRSQLQKLIADGRVQVDGRAARANLSLKAGRHVVVDSPEAVRAGVEPEDLPLDVLYDDADLVVVNKPPGLVVHPGAGHPSGTLVNALLHRVAGLSGVGGVERPGIVHRLDRGTSGVMVVAKHDAAHRELARQFQDREVDKEYIALAWGLVQAGRRIDAAIGRDPANRQKMSARARRAREAVTRITRARTLHGVSLLHVAIHTGRTHQIRVHLSAIGHPVVGDPLYGGVRRHVGHDVRAVLRLERPFLHAWRLAFTHPGDGRHLEVRAPLAGDLLAVLQDLGFEEAPAATAPEDTDA